MVVFMENTVEFPRYLPMEIYATPVRAPQANIRVETPNWFEPYIRQDVQVTNSL